MIKEVLTYVLGLLLSVLLFPVMIVFVIFLLWDSSRRLKNEQR